MQIIAYKFNDGTIEEVAVSDELYTIYMEMVQYERRLFWREAKWKVSKDYLEEYVDEHAGFDFEAHDSDPLVILIKREKETKIHKSICQLSQKQRNLVIKVFFDGITMTAVAKEQGITQQAISKQMAVIYRKLKKLL